MAKAATALLLVAALALAACGGSSSSSKKTGEAQSAASGDIPDNQVFLTFRNTAAGYSISYPEGWARSGSARDVTFQDKNNIVHVTVGSRPAAKPSGAKVVSPAKPVTLKGRKLVKTVYTTTSKPNPVTGLRAQLTVDRYELARSGRVATVDLGTPKGVDNVDAYRLMIESFKWR